MSPEHMDEYVRLMAEYRPAMERLDRARKEMAERDSFEARDEIRSAESAVSRIVARLQEIRPE